MEEAEIPKNGGHMKFGEKEDISSEGFSAHEIFATAFKAIHQTTMIMIQTRFDINFFLSVSLMWSL
ncbi:hypothetical protein TELCIR_08311 [Teladorsagia circumcincta]|uniref:Uncharacterized protein n=1 Tax=Teladorsagia circumcincta TaxID=45464 RepID=A0A2G9UI44_TELCI|nr:hypothetical protein TELCIR_08311 [Teladorsagia circumcincta]